MKLAEADLDIKSFNLDQVSQLPKTLVADTAYKQEILRLAESAEFRAIFDDFLRCLIADMRKFFELGSRSGIDVYCRFGYLNAIFC